MSGIGAFDVMEFTESYFADLKRTIDEVSREKISELVVAVNDVRNAGGTVHFIGNGGSAGTPSHSAGDWSKELTLRTICHTDNVASVTAWANDTNYDHVFVGQLETFLREGDLIIAYSGSGNSGNVINGVKYAQSRGCLVAGITGDYNGGGGGELGRIADLPIICPTTSMERIEDLQLIINHVVKESIKRANNVDASC